MRLREIRLTVVYHETLLDTLVANASRPPLPAVIEPAEYEREILAPTRSQAPLTAPWPAGGHRFWWFYLGGESPRTISPRAAFRLCVPLRKRGAAHVAEAVGAGWVRSEAFLHPWGITWLITLNWIGEISLDGAGDLVVGLREAMIQTGQGQAPQDVDALAADSLDALRREVFGIAKPGRRSATPLSLLTVVRGEVSDLAKADPDDANVQQFLHASTRLRPGWRTERVLPLKEAVSLGRRTQPVDQVAYGYDRGRATWAPRLFVATEKIHSLGCLHRNHAFVAAQVESFTGLLRATSEQFAAGAPISETHKTFVRRALGRLDALHSGAENTYRSGSVKDQIDQNGVWVLMEQLKPHVLV